MNSVLSSYPTWLILLVVVILILTVGEIGTRLARSPRAARSEGPSIAAQAAAFTIVGLLLGFSFSLALSRYDSRRNVLLREANAIGTTYLRTNLLDAGTASAIRADLRSYIGDRIDFLRAAPNRNDRAIATARSDALQRHLWMVATNAPRRDTRSTVTLLFFLSSLNDTIDLSAEESAVIEEHIPDTVIVGLVLIVLIAASVMGYVFGLEGQRGLVSKILFAAMLAIVIGLILDLDRPQSGLIRVDLSPLQTLQRSFNR